MNTIGRNFRLTTFGESHGPGLGGVIDGMPPGIPVDMDEVSLMLERRRTGRSRLTSQRLESDMPSVLSGISPEGLTLGTPIGFTFANADAHSGDYKAIEECFRPNHADFSYNSRYGIRDPRGGGRSSARETVCRVFGGAVAMQWLKRAGITFESKVTSVGTAGYPDLLNELAVAGADCKFPNEEITEARMLEEVENARRDCDSVGGRVTCLVKGLPAGLGSPVFNKLQADLAAAMMGINAAKGFEYGIGAGAADMRGSEMLDLFNEGFRPAPTQTNYAGGILGGISTGMPVFFNVCFKPTPTISRSLPMPDAKGQLAEVRVTGRHDPCVALRAPVIVEAMAALVIADAMLELPPHLAAEIYRKML